MSPSLRIPAEGIVAAGIVYALVDPLAPNWKVEATPIGGNRYRLELVMKRFITGGEGEAPAVVRRMAEKLRQEGGFTDYQILQLTEGIESRIIAQRVAHATIQLH